MGMIWVFSFSFWFILVSQAILKSFNHLHFNHFRHQDHLICFIFYSFVIFSFSSSFCLQFSRRILLQEHSFWRCLLQTIWDFAWVFTFSELIIFFSTLIELFFSLSFQCTLSFFVWSFLLSLAFMTARLLRRWVVRLLCYIFMQIWSE